MFEQEQILFLNQDNVSLLNKNNIVFLEQEQSAVSEQDTFQYFIIKPHQYVMFLNIHTLIFHVAIWPVLPYVTRYVVTYIRLYKCVLLDVFETFKCPYEHIPCVESGHTAI